MFDRRDSPAGIPHQVRLLMLIGTIVSNILIGSLTTLKEIVLYTAYDDIGRLFAMSPLADESTGGYTMWVPASMMCLVALLIVIHGWGKQETRRFARSRGWSASNSAALDNPQTAEELLIKVREPNRSAAITLAATSATMFVISLSTAVIISLLD
jgi:putative membrane protein